MKSNMGVPSWIEYIVPEDPNMEMNVDIGKGVRFKKGTPEGIKKEYMSYVKENREARKRALNGGGELLKK